MGLVMDRTIWIGWEPREADAFAVTRASLQRYQSNPRIPVRGLALFDLPAYRRPTSVRRNDAGAWQLWDEISEHWMSTEFAVSRFFVPYMAGHGWAMFGDCDLLCRTNIQALFDLCERDRSKAVYCVKHDHRVGAGAIKMDAQAQSNYSRKNWSSVMVFNCDHPANAALKDPGGIINTLPGRDLHRFCWLDDDQIGELDLRWNWLEGVSEPAPDPYIVHFTRGIPSMRGYESVAFADEWRAVLQSWVRR